MIKLTWWWLALEDDKVTCCAWLPAKQATLSQNNLMEIFKFALGALFVNVRLRQ